MLLVVNFYIIIITIIIDVIITVLVVTDYNYLLSELCNSKKVSDVKNCSFYCCS